MQNSNFTNLEHRSQWSHGRGPRSALYAVVALSPNDQMKLCIVENLSIVSPGECVTLLLIDFDTSDFRLFELCFEFVRLFSRVFGRRPSWWTPAKRLARGWLIALSVALSARFYCRCS